MKKTLKSLTAGLLVFMLCFSMASCSIINGILAGYQDGDDGKVASAYVAIDINPSIELTVSDDGTVISVYGANEDGQVLLYEKEYEITGKDVEAAIAYITELAKEMGYLSEDNSDVSTSVSAKTEEAAAALKDKIDAKIISSAEEIGLAVTINKEAAFELLSELADLKELYPDVEAIQNLTPEKYKLVVSASGCGDITIEAAAKMSNEELIKKAQETHKTLKGYATKAYLEARAKALAIFESSMGVLSDGVYTAIYTERAVKIATNPSYINTIHYGATYQAYKTASRTYLSVLQIMRFADQYTNYELNEEMISEIKTALAIADDSLLRDKDGKITLGSVSDFCYNFIDEHELDSQVKETVREILAEAKDAAELVALASDTYKTELDALKNAIKTVVESVTGAASSILPMLPEAAKLEFEACLTYLNDTSAKLAVIMESGITSDEMMLLASEAQAKADEVLEKIEEDLSDAEKTKAETMLKAIESQIKFLKNEFAGRLTNAEKDAKQYIENKYNERNGKK